MAINTEPKTEKEIQEMSNIPAAEYDFNILMAEDTVSKTSGNDMIKATLGIYVDGAIKRKIPDYLMPSMAAKLRHFCDTTGLLSQYEAGTLEAADLIGRSGRVKIGIEPEKNGYPAKNFVKDYVCRPAKPLAGQNPNAESVPEEEIPF